MVSKLLRSRSQPPILDENLEKKMRKQGRREWRTRKQTSQLQRENNETNHNQATEPATAKPVGENLILKEIGGKCVLSKNKPKMASKLGQSRSQPPILEENFEKKVRKQVRREWKTREQTRQLQRENNETSHSPATEPAAAKPFGENLI